MLELRDAVVLRDGLLVLDVAYVRFESGQVSAIVGPNGAGKTTLLRALVGLEDHGGTVLADGRNITGASARERARHVAYLPQALGVPAIDAQTLVNHGRFARLGFPHTLSDEDRAAVRAAMERTGTWALRDRRMATLSGGERQRVWLAMALAQEAPVLLLDEPGSAQDVGNRRRLWELLAELAEEGRTVVASSHDVAEAASLASRLYLVDGGCVQFEGTADELVEQPAKLRQAMGVSLVRAQGESLLHRYALAE